MSSSTERGLGGALHLGGKSKGRLGGYIGWGRVLSDHLSCQSGLTYINAVSGMGDSGAQNTLCGCNVFLLLFFALCVCVGVFVNGVRVEYTC